MTSTVKELEFKSTTVKQTPFTAILSPFETSSKNLLTSISNLYLLFSLTLRLKLPTSCIIPVNRKPPSF